MISKQLQIKIDRSIRLLKSINGGGQEVIEIAYSGGKDSDVILQLAKEAGINYRAIYKNTTIDPPGTIKHAIEMGAEIIRPEKNFFQIIEWAGFPNRYRRFCCNILKEYKVLDKAVMGVRKSESTNRMKNYNEPTECRFYGSKKNHVEAIYPILDWTDEDVVEFIVDRKIPIHKLYYREDGTIDPKRRLGCMACPIKYYKKRLDDLKQHPNLVKAWINAGKKFWETHPDNKHIQKYDNIYQHFYREFFFDKQSMYDKVKEKGLLVDDCKAYIEEYFGVKL